MRVRWGRWFDAGVERAGFVVGVRLHGDGGTKVREERRQEKGAVLVACIRVRFDGERANVGERGQGRVCEKKRNDNDQCNIVKVQRLSDVAMRRNVRMGRS